MRIRVTVADDSAEFMQEIVSALEPEFEVVGSATDGKSAIDMILLQKPDVAVLDLMMPEANGIEVARQLAINGVTSAIIICSVENDPQFVAAARQAGARGYIPKARIATDLATAINAVLTGADFFSSR